MLPPLSHPDQRYATRLPTAAVSHEMRSHPNVQTGTILDVRLFVGLRSENRVFCAKC